MTSPTTEPRADHRSLALFSLPNVMCGFAFMLTNAYLLKYSTDTLGVPVAAMGWIFFVS
jgi:Na+/melibiose symporter-like transporter